MMLSVEDLSFSYGNRKVLSDISFTLSPSHVTALLGRNGAGKSTLLRLLVGFLKPESGSVMLDGRNIREMTAKERAACIAYIPQESPVVYAHTVRDTVLMGRAPLLSVFSKPGKKDEEKADEVIHMLGLDKLASRSATEISGGEKQLAVIARALAQEAEILILDEPAASLDYSNRLRLLETLTSLARNGYTVFFSTHSPDEALMGDTSIMTMDDEGCTVYEKNDLVGTDVLSRLYGIKLDVLPVTVSEKERIVCIPE